jgi:predicted amino acid-binding ACT domain protein
MSAVAFDTLKFAQTLRDKAKFTPEQAEGLSEAFAQASADQLATKSDITGLRSDLKGDIVDLRTELKADIIELRTELKADIVELRTELKADIVELRTELKIDIAELRSDLRESELRLETKIETTKADTLKWMFGTIGFQTIVILGAVLALSRFGH